MVEWSLQDAINFVKQWETKEEMMDHKPAIDSETWNEICVVFDICQSHGYDPSTVNEHMVSYFEGGQQQEPEDIEDFEDIYAGEAHGKPQYISRKDAFIVLEESGFDSEVSKLLLSESQGNLAKALEIGTNMNLEKREADGEFTTMAVPIEMIPKKTAPTEMIPKKTSPTEMIPEETAPTEMIPEETAPTEMIPQETEPNETIVVDLEEEPLSSQQMDPFSKIPVVEGFDDEHVRMVLNDLEKEDTQWDDDLLIRRLHEFFPQVNPDTMQTIPWDFDMAVEPESKNLPALPENGLLELAAQKAYRGFGWRLRFAAYNNMIIMYT